MWFSNVKMSSFSVSDWLTCICLLTKLKKIKADWVFLQIRNFSIFSKVHFTFLLFLLKKSDVCFFFNQKVDLWNIMETQFWFYFKLLIKRYVTCYKFLIKEVRSGRVLFDSFSSCWKNRLNRAILVTEKKMWQTSFV